jgi:phosphotriesterase-related protein
VSDRSGRVQTVLGLVEPARLGLTLMHEHLLLDQVAGVARFLNPDGAPGQSPGRTASERSRWEEDLRLDNVADVRRHFMLYRTNLQLHSREEAVHELGFFRAAGGGCIVEATPLGLGRDPAGLQAIARLAQVHVVMGCGYYVWQNHPADMDARTEDQLTEEIVSDLTEGVDGVVAGIIGEIGLSWPVHPNEARVLRAAARAQRETGCALTIHPGRNPAAPMDAVRAVIAAGGDPGRTILDHLDRTLFKREDYLELAQTGCFLELDMFGYETSHYPASLDVDVPNDALRVQMVRHLCEQGHRDQVVLAHDIAMKHYRRQYGGWGYDHILVNVVPLMLRRGLGQADVDAFLVHNPARALTIC